MRRKTALLAGIMMLLLNAAMGQKKRAEYFTDDWRPLKKSYGATYYRIIESDGDGYLVKDFRVKSDSLYRTMQCSHVSPEVVRHGKTVEYYRNGTMKAVEWYDLDEPTGLWTTYYDNGTLREEMIYRGDERLWIQCWSQEGKPLLVQGTGEVVKDVDEGAETRHTMYVDSLLVSSFSIRHQRCDTVYYVTDEMASYKDGFEDFYRELGGHLKGKYPKKARRMGVEGRVFIQFIVSKDGHAIEPKVLRGIGAGCDEVAVEALQSITGWTPARHMGQVVQQLFVLPVVFRLN